MPTFGEMQEQAATPRVHKPEHVAESAADKLIRQDAERRERERLERRKAIRADIAKRGELAKELSLIEGQLKALDARADEAANRHQVDTGPVQDKLQTAEGAVRDKLLTQLAECNVTLERELDIIRRVREPLQKQHRVTRTAMAECKTEAFLVGGDVARPSLLAELFACQQRIKAAEARVETARGYLASYEPELEMARTVPVRPSIEGWGQPNAKPVIDLDRVHNLAERVRRWTCELTHASAELHAAQGASREIERDMIDES